MDSAAAMPDHGELLTCLKGAIEEVFSTMLGFMPAVASGGQADASMETPAQAEQRDNRALETQAAVGFHGPLDGTVVLRCSESGGRNITRGLLMMDEEEIPDDADVNDALGECANMVGGLLKRQILDPRADFTLGIPEVTRIDSPLDGLTQGQLVYRLAQGVLAAEIYIKTP